MSIFFPGLNFRSQTLFSYKRTVKLSDEVSGNKARLLYLKQPVTLFLLGMGAELDSTVLCPLAVCFCATQMEDSLKNTKKISDILWKWSCPFYLGHLGTRSKSTEGSLRLQKPTNHLASLSCLHPELMETMPVYSSCPGIIIIHIFSIWLTPTI